MPARKCKAVTKRGPCQGNAMKGQMVCYSHGGAAPQNRAAGEWRQAEAKAATQLKDLADAPPLGSIGDVYDWLLGVAGTAKAWSDILQGRVAQLNKLGTESSEYVGTQLKADVILFERALDRSAKIAESLVRLDLEGRKQALDERIAGQLVAVVKAILGDLELSDDQRMVAELVVPKRMKEISA